MSKEKIVFIIMRNLKYWKKSWIKTSLLMIITAFLMVMIGILGYSILNYFDKIQFQSPDGRSIMINTNEADSQSVYKLLTKYADESNEVVNVHYANPTLGGHVNNATSILNVSEPKEKNRFGELSLYSDYYTNDEYLLSGRWINKGESNVMLVPANLSFNGITEDFMKKDVDRIKGKSLIGTEIEISYYSYKEEGNKFVVKNEYKETFKVIGTYDNVILGNDENSVIIPDVDITRIKKTIDDDMNNKINYNYRVLIKDSQLNNKVMQEISGLLKNYEVGIYPVVRPGILIRVLVPFMQTVMLASIILFIIGFFMQKSLINRLIYKRSDEIGTLKVMGYSEYQISQFFIAEIVMFGIITFVLTLFASFICKEAIQFWVRNYTGYMFSSMPLVFNIKDILLAFMMLVIIPLISGIFNLKALKAIQPIDAISGVVE